MEKGPEQGIETIEDVERVMTQLHRKKWQAAWGYAYFMIAAIVVILVYFVFPKLIADPVRIAVGVALGIGAVPAVLVETRMLRAVKAAAEELRNVQHHALAYTPLRAGEELKRHVVLVAEPDMLHVADRRSIGQIVVYRILLLAISVLGVIGFGVGLYLLGPLLSSIWTRHGKLNLVMLIAFWITPVLSFIGLCVSMMPYPVQWIASREERSLTLEDVVWLWKRRLRVIPVDSIAGFTFDDDGDVGLIVDKRRVRLTRLVTVDALVEGKKPMAKEDYKRLNSLRKSRVARAMGECVGIPSDRLDFEKSS